MTTKLNVSISTNLCAPHDSSPMTAGPTPSSRIPRENNVNSPQSPEMP